MRRCSRAWRGFTSPLRHRDALSSCPQGGHRLWWFVEAPDEAAALGQLPEYVSRQTEVTNVCFVPTLDRGVVSPAGAVTMTPSAPTGGLQRSTRAAVGVLLVLAVLNAAFLYLLPARAAPATRGRSARRSRPRSSAPATSPASWRPRSRCSPRAAGARSSRWPIALVTLSVGLLAATLLHTARFRWGYPPTWVWTGVYALAPVGVVILARRQRAITIRPLVADPRLRLLRVLSGVFGAAMLAGAIALFAFPADLGRDWPWPLTTLLAQAIAAWIAMIAAALLWCAYDLRRTHEAFIPYATLAAWCLALLALPALHAGELTRTGAPLLSYLGALIALLALAVLGVTRAGRLSR